MIKQKSPSVEGPFKSYVSARRAYLPGSHPPSTSAAEELNDRVRNGNGCVLLAMTTRIQIVKGKYPQSCVLEMYSSCTNLSKLASELTTVLYIKPSAN